MDEEEREASSTVFDRWMGKAAENIDKWGLQDEQTLLLALQEELGELTQAHLEATHEDGDPSRIDDELDDLGALLLQLHEARQKPDSYDFEEDPLGLTEPQLMPDGGVEYTPRRHLEGTLQQLEQRQTAVKDILGANWKAPNNTITYLQGYFDALNLATDEVRQAKDAEIMGITPGDSDE